MATSPRRWRLKNRPPPRPTSPAARRPPPASSAGAQSPVRSPPAATSRREPLGPARASRHAAGPAACVHCARLRGRPSFYPEPWVGVERVRRRELHAAILRRVAFDAHQPDLGIRASADLREELLPDEPASRPRADDFGHDRVPTRCISSLSECSRRRYHGRYHGERARNHAAERALYRRTRRAVSSVLPWRGSTAPQRISLHQR